MVKSLCVKILLNDERAKIYNLKVNELSATPENRDFSFVKIN